MAPVFGATCEEVTDLVFPGAKVTASQSFPAGQYPVGWNESEAYLPEHCRVAAVLEPSVDSHIEMEIWLPQSKRWNGKFLAVGNGGWGGRIALQDLGGGLRRGYAVAANDTGHNDGNNTAAFVLGHPEKLIDYAYRGMHEMTVFSKTLIGHFYQRSADLSYFEGCSTGGRQGLMSAQRYPEDFDAIIAGAPVYNLVKLHASQMHKTITILKDSTLFVSNSQKQLVNSAVLEACEVNDGVLDGFLSNPQECDFEPASLLCTTTDTQACLTSSQVDSLTRAYASVQTDFGEEVYPGHAKGFELGWRVPQVGSEPASLSKSTFSYIVHEDELWDWKTFDLEIDARLALARADIVAAEDFDLSEFKANGGKLLLYHGWNDPGPSPFATINYYNNVLNTMGPDQSEWLRLFMLPGVEHCGGGIGPDRVNFLKALVSWKERNVAPEEIKASRFRNGSVDMTRLLCSYPKVAVWDGKSSTNDSSSFVCVIP